MCQRTPQDEADLPDWLGEHIDDPELLSVVAGGGWRFAAAFYRGVFLRAVEREKEKDQEIAKLKGEISQLKHQLFGRKSESRNGSEKVDASKMDEEQKDGSEKPPQEKRKRGGQPGHQGQPRKERSQLPVSTEMVSLTEAEKHCQQCGQPYAPFPPRRSSRIEYEIKIFVQQYEHERACRGCQCQQSPGIVEASAPPLVIPKSSYGNSVWREILLEKFFFHHPNNHFVRAWQLHDESGMSPSVLNGGLRRLQPLFEPVYDLIVERNQLAGFWHADETGWPVFGEPRQKEGRARWQMWVFRAEDAVIYIIRPSRATDVPLDHFPEGVIGIIIVDRFSVYKKLANEYEGIILVFCWAHVRRDFLDAAKKYSGELEAWAMSWIEEIAQLYRLYKARAKKMEECAEEYPDLCVEEKVRVVAAAEQEALEAHVTKMKERWEKELAELGDDGTEPDNELEPDNEPEPPADDKKKRSPKAKRQRRRELAHREEKAKVLRSLRRHWCGLTLFLDYPDIPLDNNAAERALRGGAVGRKNYYGSGSQWSVDLTESLFSIFATLEAWQINVRTWLSDYLDYCASNGGKAPEKEEIKDWMPWNMSEERRQKMSQPKAHPPPQGRKMPTETEMAANGAGAISAAPK